MSRIDLSRIITLDPGKRDGKPCIRGLRITVYDVLEYLASGMTEQQILDDFPELTPEDIRAWGHHFVRVVEVDHAGDEPASAALRSEGDPGRDVIAGDEVVLEERQPGGCRLPLSRLLC